MCRSGLNGVEATRNGSHVGNALLVRIILGGSFTSVSSVHKFSVAVASLAPLVCANGLLRFPSKSKSIRPVVN
jgi:hypothetical protein